MPVYKLMGGDGKEYGPVDAHQVKTWIGEHRLEKKSPVMVDEAKDWVFLESRSEFTSALAAQSDGASPPVIGRGGSLNAIIPYKNPRALIAYYCGVFAVLPVIGILFGFIGLVLGISGLRFRRRKREAGGAVHAWIGILVGGFFALLWLALVCGVIVAKLRNH